MIMIGIGYNQMGEGIAKYNGKVFYIPGLLINEEAEVKITLEMEKWGKARIIKLLRQSPNRVTPPNGWDYIGGYELMHMNREEQTIFKTKKIIDDFKTNAKHNILLEKIYIGKKQIRYRNKITLHDGGFYKRNTREIIKLDDFLLTEINPYTNKMGDVIFRKLDTLIIGKKNDNLYTTDSMLGKKFRVSIGAFYQINKEVAEAAYKEMLNHINEGDNVFDLYSGIGTISIIVSTKANKIWGVERNKHSYKDALFNMKMNQTKNVEFVKKDVLDFLKQNKINPDVIIVDPAREGMKKSVCDEIIKLKPRKIIYLSCNPATQAADFNRLKSNYEIKFAKPYDMFPNTYHIENLIVLEKK